MANEIEREFYDDSRDKKRIAASASKRVGKRKKVSMPYELMSKEERKKYMAPSEVTTFKLRPMKLDEFKKQPADQQIELLKWYGERYGWNPAAIADVLETSYNTGKRFLHEYMLTGMFKRNMKESSKEQRQVYMANRKDLLDARAKVAAEIEREAKIEQEEEIEQETAQDAPLEELVPEEISIPETEEMPAQEAAEAVKPTYEIILTGGRHGRDLRRILEGIAHSLDEEMAYRVSLSISEFSPILQDHQCERNVVDA